ncbi:MAG: efflux RND transporter permease subunit [Verrucomicrobiota bacterium]
MEGLIHWFSRNHVAANFLMLVILVQGFMTWFELKKEIFPETGLDAVFIQVPYPNAAPEETETGVCIPIEEAIQDVNGIERVTSTASESIGVVVAEIAAGYETREVMDDITTRINAIDNFAEQAEEPIIEELLLKAQVLSVVVTGSDDERSLRLIGEKVRDLLADQEEISQVSLAGVRDYEIAIEVSEQTLREYGLTFDRVANAVRASSLDLPSGSLRTDAGEILIRAANKRYTASEFRGITVLTKPDGSRIELGAIATVTDGFSENVVKTRINGEPGVLINVFRVGNEDTRKLADAAKRVVEEAPASLPAGFDLTIWNDTSVYLKGRMSLLAKNGLFGLILVFIVLALFLQPSLAFLVSIGIPVSFAGAIMLMPWNGISINMISLFAFILVLGIVVDDAIIVGENVFRRMRSGEDPKVAAPKGTHEVGVVVIFGILTTVAAFTPMLGLSGVSGKIWPNIPLVVIPTLLFSLVQSKLILPSHLALLNRVDENRNVSLLTRFRRKFTDGLELFVDKLYRPALRVCLNNRYTVLSAFIAVFMIVVSVVAFGWIKFQFFPEVEAEIISAKLTMEKGVSVDTTEAAVNQIEAAALEISERYEARDGSSIVKQLLTSVGTQPFQTGFDGIGGPPLSENVGEVTMELSSAEDRTMTATELTAIWRELTGDIPAKVELIFRTESGAGGNAIDLEIAGTNLVALEQVADEVKQKLDLYAGVIDIADSNRVGKRELKLEILPSAEALNLRLADLAKQVRQGFYGEEAQRLQRGRDEVKVMVRYPRQYRESIEDLHQMRIRLPDGSEVPFSAVARARFSYGFASINRSDRKRAISITADIDKTVPGANANQIVRDLETSVFPQLKARYPGTTFTFFGEQKDQRQSVKEIGLGALVALIIMYVLMAIPLRSYVQPIIIMAVIPFGLVGAVIGHIIMGIELSIMSMCGIVALAGVVVNDSLVLVDYVNRQKRNGISSVDSAWEAGAARFRAILLTSLTTFAGLTPMLLETDLQAKFLIPMAVSLAFGILFATVIVLVLVPCIYLILGDLGRLLFGKDPDEEVAIRAPAGS